MKLKCASVVLFAILAMVAGSLEASQVGVWQLNGDLSNALPGGAMSVAGGWTPTYVTEMIGGSPATVLSFPAMSSSQALDMPNDAAPNGGSATTTNIWTIVMDVRFPSVGNFTALWETLPLGAGDADFFVRDTEGIGTSGQYFGTYVPEVWNRLAVTVTSTGGPGTGYAVTGHINGTLTGTSVTSTSPDGKEAIAAALHLFADEDGETSAGLVNSVAYYDEVLSESAIAALGAASAAGIPAVPEPASLILLGLGLWGAFAKRSRS
jgi:hypothetical protein